MQVGRRRAAAVGVMLAATALLMSGPSPSTAPPGLVLLAATTADSTELFSGAVCSGALTSPTTVLTVDHCVGGALPDAILGLESVCPTRGAWERVGTTSAQPIGDGRIVKLTLTAAVQSEPFRTDTLSTGRLVAFGWGSQDSNLPPACEPKQASLDRVDVGYCEAVGQEANQPASLCALPRRGSVNTCHGDSGGPVLQDGRLVALTLSGVGCGVGDPGLYVMLSEP
ncbi:trypsin-like serine protease [Zafaria sp. Z1313]|uniref:trypsin-like serine protease n=1 Tax=Zafaria sp. Z1313 TaxID=3423202 RepID=UPI003D3032BA